MNINNKQTINDLKNFYIDHMIEIYNHDWDKFWEDHENIMELEYELTNNTELKVIEELKDLAYEVCPLHRTDDLDDIIERL